MPDWSTTIFRAIVIGLMTYIALTLTDIKLAHAEDAAIGDSIALGTGRALHVPTYAAVGKGSCDILKFMSRRHFDHVVISAGINDPPGACVTLIRSEVNADRVTWILPAPINSARKHIALVALLHGDQYVTYDCPGGCSRRSFHPSSYAVVARAVRETWSR